MIFECKDVTLGYENKVVAKNLNYAILLPERAKVLK